MAYSTQLAAERPTTGDPQKDLEARVSDLFNQLKTISEESSRQIEDLTRRVQTLERGQTP